MCPVLLDQNKGRCGRVGPGHCIRLYSEEDFDSRPEFLEPEMHRANLAGVLLRLIYLGVREVERFPFLDTPEPKLIRDGYKLLALLGALDEGRLTTVGKLMAKLPCEPRLGRILVAASYQGCLKEILAVVSGLNVGQLWEREAPVSHPQSDFMLYALLWPKVRQQKAHLSHSRFKKWCDEKKLSLVRLLEWLDVYHQLLTICTDSGLRLNQTPGNHQQIHMALLTGFIDNIGMKTEKGFYQGARVQYLLHPSSQIKAANWVMGAQILHSSKIFLITAAKIQPEWLVKAAPTGLIKKQYSEPVFDLKSGRVIAEQSLWLFGLPIQGRRRINYDKVSLIIAREVFIRSALVEHNIESNLAFYQHNKKLYLQAKHHEARIRHKRVLFNEQALFDFYNETLPSHIHSVQGLDKISTDIQQSLFLPTDNKIFDPLTEHEQRDFPDTLSVKAQTYDLHYICNLEHQRDGISLVIPKECLVLLDSNEFSSLVPGLLSDKIEITLKALPKWERRKLIPFEQHLRKITQASQAQVENFNVFIKQYLLSQYKIRIDDDFIQSIDLPAYLKPHFGVRVNQTVVWSDDLKWLATEYGQQELTAKSTCSKQIFRDWSFGHLPLSEKQNIGGISTDVYIGLTDIQDGVVIKGYTTASEAAAFHSGGVARLIFIALGKVNQQLIKQGKLRQQFSEQQLDALFMVGIKGSFLTQAECRDQDDLNKLLTQNKSCYLQNVQAILRSITEYSKLKCQLEDSIKILHKKHHDISAQLDDVQFQLQNLFNITLAQDIPLKFFLRLPLYVKGMQLRLEKILLKPTQDRIAMKQVHELEKHLAVKLKCSKEECYKHLVAHEIRWLFEECRLSLFAQQLKTITPISIKRLQKRIGELSY